MHKKVIIRYDKNAYKNETNRPRLADQCQIFGIS